MAQVRISFCSNLSNRRLSYHSNLKIEILNYSIGCSGIYVKTGASLCGVWKDGQLNGRGIAETPDGTYEGEFVNGQRSGKGTFQYKYSSAKLRRYVGDWQNDLPHGLGSYRDENGREAVFK